MEKEKSFEDMHETVEKLRVALLTLAAKEAFFRKNWEYDRQEIWDELTLIREAIESAPTIAERAKELGLVIADPNRERSAYVGTVVALDHLAVLIQFTSKAAVVLPFSALVDGQSRPERGDRVRIEFRNRELSVSIQVSPKTTRRNANT